MGDMADMALEHLFDIMEAEDMGCFDGDEDPDNYVGPRRRVGPLIKTCKFCGEKGLVWMKTAPNKWGTGDKSGGWRLAKNGVIHTCGKKNK